VPAHHLDFVTHATNPIVHAADDRSVMQTLEALPFITRSVRAIHGDMPYHIGPSTIAMRQNPYGNATKDNPHLDRIPMANRDPRHNGLFAAAWAVGYVVRCLPAQSSLITLSALAGDFGLIAGEGEPVVQGGMRPLYHVVEALAQMGGAAWTECHSSDPGRMLGLTVEHPQRGCLSMIANLTPSPQMADLSALGANAGARIAMLDAQSLGACKMSQADFGGQTLQLDSYAVAFLRQPSRS
jgi:D-apionolactonase